MTLLNKKNMYLALVVFLITFALLLAFGGNRQGLSIISADTIQYADDGTPMWRIFADGINSGNDEYQFVVRAVDVPPAPVSGGDAVPQKDIKLNGVVDKVVCSYSLGNEESLSNVALLDNSKATDSFFSRESTASFPIIDGSGKTQMFMDFTDLSSGKSQTLDILNFADSITFTNSDGDGQVSVQARGGLQGNYKQCPEFTGRYATEFVDQNNLIIFSEIRNNFFGLSEFKEVSPIVFDTRGFTCDIQGKQGTTSHQLVCTSTTDDTSTINPTFTLTADANYFDFYYKPSSTGFPKIINIDKSLTGIQEGQESAITVRVKNAGSNDGSFKLYVTSDFLSFPIDSKITTLKAGDEGILRFGFIAPDVVADGTFDGEVKFCNIVDSGNVDCVTSSFDVNVENNNFILPDPTPIIDPKTCDGANEGYDKVAQECSCNTGFSYDQDYLGRDFCAETKTSNSVIFLMLTAGMFTILIMAVIITRRKK